MALNSNTKKFLWTLVIPLVLTIIITIVLFFTVGVVAAQLFSYGATTLVMFGALAYIVFWDSKKRWPGLTMSQRATKVLTFER